MSILSYPQRGPWGKAQYRGNCSGYVYQDVIKALKPRVVVDPMQGSGTCLDVCRDLGVEGHGFDLAQGFNILDDDLLQAVGKEVDLAIAHPPYWSMVIYSGEVWGEAHPSDLSRAPTYDDFCEKLQLALLNQRNAARAGGHYAAILGDWRQHGNYYSLQAEAVARLPRDELAGILIKVQHNTKSQRVVYPLSLPRIEHEYVVVWRKRDKSVFMLVTSVADEQQRRKDGTWLNIVRRTLQALGGRAQLRDVYEAVAKGAGSKVQNNPNYQAKIRQVLNQNRRHFTGTGDGTWSLA